MYLFAVAVAFAVIVMPFSTSIEKHFMDGKQIFSHFFADIFFFACDYDNDIGGC